MVQFDEDQRVLDFLIDNGLASLKGQADVAVALGGLHPASNCAGTFFPVARLVKIIASHSEGPPLTSGTRATRAHSLDLLLQSSPEANTWT